jgi:hypothetical protein
MKVDGRGDRDCEIRSVALEMDSGDSGGKSTDGCCEHDKESSGFHSKVTDLLTEQEGYSFE